MHRSFSGKGRFTLNIFCNAHFTQPFFISTYNYVLILLLCNKILKIFKEYKFLKKILTKHKPEYWSGNILSRSAITNRRDFRYWLLLLFLNWGALVRKLNSTAISVPFWFLATLSPLAWVTCLVGVYERWVNSSNPPPRIGEASFHYRSATWLSRNSICH